MWLLTEPIELANSIKIKFEMFPVGVQLLGFRHFGTGHRFIETETN